MGEKPVLEFTFSNNEVLKVTSNHKFITDVENVTEVLASSLAVGDVVESMDGSVTITSIKELTVEKVYDLIDVANGHVYYTNRIISHNCEMLSSDQLLIDTRVLFGMKLIDEPVLEYNEFTFWEKLQSEQTYIVTVDPSTGSGLDYSVIDVYHFPSLNQVAQFRSNSMNSPMLYAKLKWVLEIMEQKMCTTYFTIENNGVGEGILALYQNDENPPEYAEMVSDGGTRDGMNTNKSSKLKSCVSLKELFEAGKIQVNSPQTLKELKNFVRRKGSYEAQIGSTDDTVSCLLLLTRTLIEISSHEQAAFDKLYRFDEKDYFTGGSADNSSEDDNDPLPMVF